MDCTKASVLMSAAVDGELSFSEEEHFLSHLSECKECSGEFDDAKKN